jgi:excisionase family DNA binding protein
MYNEKWMLYALTVVFLRASGMTETYTAEPLPPPPYSIDEAAEKLNLSRQALRAAARRGDLAGFRVGRDWRLLRGPIDRLLRSGESAG